MTLPNIYFVEQTDPTSIRFLRPTTEIVPLTGKAPCGFDGAEIHRKVDFPAILLSFGFPNRLVRDPEELKAYRLDFLKADRKRAA